jgi:hypothetical protein
MKLLMPVSLICSLFVSATLLAAPADDIIAASKKLGATDNYSWTTTPEGGQRFGGPTQGKTEKDGFTSLSLTMRDTTAEVVLKGDKGALKTDGDWTSLSDASKDDGGGFNPTRFLAMRMQTFKTPADEAPKLATNAVSLKLEDGAYSGDLTEAYAKELMTFGRSGQGPTVTNAKGSVKFWITDGSLIKYQVKVSGHIDFNGNERDVDRTTTTEIKDIGKTKVDVSDDAKKKIG